MLLSIALFPLLAPAFWHHHYPKVSAAWSAVVIVPCVLAYGAPARHELAHVTVVDYVPFIILLGALFTIGGGIYVRGGLRGTPWVNGTLMLSGTLLASWVGTTGAAMLLVRPLLRANRARRDPPPHAGGVLADDAAAHSRRQRVHLGADQGGGDPVRGHLRDHHSRARHAARGRARRARIRRPRRARAGAFLLGERNPVVISRQRAHVPDLPVDSARPTV